MKVSKKKNTADTTDANEKDDSEPGGSNNESKLSSTDLAPEHQKTYFTERNEGSDSNSDEEDISEGSESEFASEENESCGHSDSDYQDVNVSRRRHSIPNREDERADKLSNANQYTSRRNSVRWKHSNLALNRQKSKSSKNGRVVNDSEPNTLDTSEVEEPYECLHCGKKFSTSVNVTQHIIFNHRDEKSWECDICPEKFHQWFMLHRHLRAHGVSQPNRDSYVRKNVTDLWDIQKEYKIIAQGRSSVSDGVCRVVTELKGSPLQNLVEDVHDGELLANVAALSVAGDPPTSTPDDENVNVTYGMSHKSLDQDADLPAEQPCMPIVDNDNVNGAYDMSQDIFDEECYQTGELIVNDMDRHGSGSKTMSDSKKKNGAAINDSLREGPSTSWSSSEPLKSGRILPQTDLTPKRHKRSSPEEKEGNDSSASYGKRACDDPNPSYIEVNASESSHSMTTTENEAVVETSIASINSIKKNIIISPRKRASQVDLNSSPKLRKTNSSENKHAITEPDTFKVSTPTPDLCADSNATTTKRSLRSEYKKCDVQVKPVIISDVLFTGIDPDVQKPYECLHCGKRFSTSSHVIQHIGYIHKNEKPWKCDICPKKFLEWSKLKKHLKTHEVSQPIREEYGKCNAKAEGSLRNEYTKHVFVRRNEVKETTHQNISGDSNASKLAKDSGADSPAEAPVSALSDDTNSNGVLAVSQNALNESVTILQESKSLDNEDDTGKYEPDKIQGDEQSFKCSFCSKEFKNKSSLGGHNRTVHTEEKRYDCQHCGKLFSSSWNLNRHFLSAHRNEKSWECDICGKKLCEWRNLQRHLKNEHGVTQPRRESYAKSNAETSDLAQSGKKSYECLHCGKMFSCSGNVVQHILYIHKTEKPWECDICPKTFCEWGKLRGHLSKAHEVTQAKRESYIKSNAKAERSSLQNEYKKHEGESDFMDDDNSVTELDGPTHQNGTEDVSVAGLVDDVAADLSAEDPSTATPDDENVNVTSTMRQKSPN